MNRKQQLAVLAGLAISAAFLWFAFRDLHPEAVLDTMNSADPRWLTASALVYFPAVVIIALRWQFLLRAMRYVPLAGLFRLVCIGYLGNNVYPFRSGEALRIFLLKRNYGIPVFRAATTVVVERVFDGLVLLSFVVGPLLVIDLGSADIRRVTTVAAPVFLTALAVFLVLAARPVMMRRAVSRVGGLLPGRIGGLVVHIGEEISLGLDGLRTPLHLAGTVASSYLTWMVQAVVFWMVSFAFDLDLSFAVMLVAVGAVNLAGLIPATPGQIGVFEFFGSAVLTAAGAPASAAASFALMVHIIIWLPVTLVGFYFLARQGLGWKAITRARKLDEEGENTTALPL